MAEEVVAPQLLSSVTSLPYVHTVDSSSPPLPLASPERSSFVNSTTMYPPSMSTVSSSRPSISPSSYPTNAVNGIAATTTSSVNVISAERRDMPSSSNSPPSGDALTNNLERMKITNFDRSVQLNSFQSTTTNNPTPNPNVLSSSTAQTSNPDRLAPSRASNSGSISVNNIVSSTANASNLSSSASNSNPSRKQGVRYTAERVIGNGSFGVVYQASVNETGETVAIKKVLQDPKFKNRELQIMGMMNHPCIISLRQCFYSRGEKPDEIYLNLVMDYVPETIHRALRTYTKANKLLPIMMIKAYMYQISRSLAYIHSLNIAHRDIKPQNLLLNSRTHIVKLCDFGSAKILQPGENNVAYICSRYYRAPELVFEATKYATSIDLWSLGCVMAEMLLGTPLFPGESAVDQLIEIVKVLGTPSREEVFAMNPNNQSFNFPQIQGHPWTKVFKNKVPSSAVDLVQNLLRFDPSKRIPAFEALAHPFFDELRVPNVQMPGNTLLPPDFFNFTEGELKLMQEKGLTDKLIPVHLRSQYNLP